MALARASDFLLNYGHTQKDDEPDTLFSSFVSNVLSQRSGEVVIVVVAGAVALAGALFFALYRPWELN
jgi:hypothetical protein